MARFLSLIRSDFNAIRARDPAARGAIETLLTYPGLHATFAHRIAHILWRNRWRSSARLLSYLARMVTGIDIHPGAKIGPGFFIDHGAGVVIGETAEIGCDVTLYHGVTLGGVSWNGGKRHPTLEDRVMVGAGAKILGPICVGADARVGANSVVVEEVPPEATVVGIPARIVQSATPRSSDPYRVNLNHHLMPDPVGRTLLRLADRIAFLEARLDARGPGKTSNVPSEPCSKPVSERSPELTN
ncbi:serine O-acetyltransferase [Cognatiyoonia sp. IB215182]|uniref:serine O-acetyltransferase n=1 Tax=Cognatiyoonia sp. IB215182 TaxID=3097353 RepID=UPI002A11096E|nr:serine O-acetyltransferase [Cognatiyoonia sp. IB215182]MDX8355453.1 serine O-acetyltransferase [Cognatiyoonia sp. IB215182]